MGLLEFNDIAMAVTHMTQQACISSRINAQLKQQGDSILAEIGVKPSQAITMFYKQIVRQRGLLFETRIPNDQTIEAIQELKDPETRKNLKRFSSAEELMFDLDS